MLESLSEQLSLDELWSTLSACLRELADTPDHHAVLVLQPTVEAFFLVHAAVTSNQEKKKPNQKETRQEQLAHIQVRDAGGHRTRDTVEHGIREDTEGHWTLDTCHIKSH